MRATNTEYRRTLQELLPAGSAWPRDEDAILTKVLGGVAPSLARVHNRALDLIEEADPRTTREMIDDWERCCGLPDECTPANATTLQERRAAVVAKLTYRGAQDTAYFEALAGSLGYAVAIEEFRPFVCGLSRCGDRLNGGHEVRYYWRVRILEPRVTWFRTGVSSPPERLGKINYAEDLECILNRLKPAHTYLVFAYDYEEE